MRKHVSSVSLEHNLCDKNEKQIITEIIIYYKYSFFLAVYQAKWVMDPFAPKIYFLIQNNFGLNFGLNIFTCEQS